MNLNSNSNKYTGDLILPFGGVVDILGWYEVGVWCSGTEAHMCKKQSNIYLSIAY